MTIQSTDRKAGPFLSGTVLPFEFKVFSKEDIAVIYTNAEGVEVVLVLDSDCSVTLNADQDNNPGGTATLTTPIVSGDRANIIGDLAYDQGTDIRNQGGFEPEIIEDALDRATIQIQQLKEISDRTLKTAPGDSRTGDELLADIFEAEGNAAASAAAAEESANRVDLGALDDAVAQTQADVVTTTTQAGIATTQAGISTAQAEISTVNVGLTAANLAGAEAAEASAIAAGVTVGVYTTVAAGLAAAASGEYFYVVNATTQTIALYLDNAGTAVLQGEPRSLRSWFTDKEFEVIGTPAYSTVTETLTTVDVNDVITILETGELLISAPITLSAGTQFSAAVRVLSGTPASMIIEQRDGSNVVVQSDTLVQVGQYWIAEKITVTATTSTVRARFRQNVGGSGTITLERPRFVLGPVAPTSALYPHSKIESDLYFWDNQANPNLFDVFDVQAVSGSFTQDGREITVNSESIAEISLRYSTGGISIGEQLTLTFRSETLINFVQVREYLAEGGASSGTSPVPVTRIGRSDYYTATFTTGFASASALGIRVRIDTRAASNGITAPAHSTTINEVSVVRGANPMTRKVPFCVTDEIQKALSSFTISGVKAYVDGTSGSDSNDGTLAAPFATFSAALAAGAQNILARVGTYRTNFAVATAGLSIQAYRLSGDTDEYVSIYSSDLRDGVTDFTVDGTFTNLYRRNEATNPQGVWEVESGVATRMGIETPSGAPRLRPATTLAEADANPGSWIWDTGVLYVHPYASTIAGKTYEVPNADRTIDATGARLISLKGVLASYGRVHSLYALRTYVNLENSVIQSSGLSDAYFVQESWSMDNNCIFRDAGDDGYNTNGQVVATSVNSKFIDNQGDGYAPHANGHDCVLSNCEMTGNGKQGFVSIATGRFRLYGCESRNNRDAEYLVDPNAGTDASVFEMYGCTGQNVIVRDGTGPVTAKIRNYVGSSIQSSATLCDAESIDVRGGGDGIRCDAGVMNVTGFKSRKQATAAIRLDGGTLTIKDGHALRSTRGIFQTGGTLVLDSADPINVFGNTTQFDGVSAPDQALTLSFQAI